MFSIGFAELLIIAVITLLVVGPERLPETIRFISLNLAKFKRYWQSTRRDLEKDLGLEDLRREIHNAAVKEHLQETKQMLNKSIDINPEQAKEASKKESSLVEEALADPKKSEAPEADVTEPSVKQDSELSENSIAPK